MKKLFFAISALALNGCASMTVHDYCQENSAHYQNYDECYAEVSRSHANKSAASRFFRGFSDGYNRGTASQTMNCTGYAYGNTVNATCN